MHIVHTNAHCIQHCTIHFSPATRTLHHVYALKTSIHTSPVFTLQHSTALHSWFPVGSISPILWQVQGTNQWLGGQGRESRTNTARTQVHWGLGLLQVILLSTLLQFWQYPVLLLLNPVLFYFTAASITLTLLQPGEHSQNNSYKN